VTTDNLFLMHQSGAEQVQSWPGKILGTFNSSLGFKSDADEKGNQTPTVRIGIKNYFIFQPLWMFNSVDALHTCGRINQDHVVSLWSRDRKSRALLNNHFQWRGLTRNACTISVTVTHTLWLLSVIAYWKLLERASITWLNRVKIYRFSPPLWFFLL